MDGCNFWIIFRWQVILENLTFFDNILIVSFIIGLIKYFFMIRGAIFSELYICCYFFICALNFHYCIWTDLCLSFIALEIELYLLYSGIPLFSFKTFGVFGVNFIRNFDRKGFIITVKGGAHWWSTTLLSIFNFFKFYLVYLWSWILAVSMLLFDSSVWKIFIGF